MERAPKAAGSIGKDAGLLDEWAGKAAAPASFFFHTGDVGLPAIRDLIQRCVYKGPGSAGTRSLPTDCE
eukprot:6154373-Amphidinium_carterae.1